MLIQLLKSKIHRATVTSADLNYQGSISIDRALLECSKIVPWERVDIYNVTNGARFSTYAIEGAPGEITLNGAAARCVAVGDKIIIASYGTLEESAAAEHQPTIILVDGQNRPLASGETV